MPQPTPRARTILLTDTGTVAFLVALAACDGIPSTPTPSPTPTPAPSFTELPSIEGTPEVGQALTAMDGTILYATEVTRRWLLGSAFKSTAVTWLATSAGELVLEVTATGPGGSMTKYSDPVVVVEATTGTPSPLPFSAIYAQGMGATAADGMVASIPLPTDAKRMYLDTRNGSGASDSYNGLSPYPGFKLNGTGPDNQYGATGMGAADAAYGPKLNFLSAETALGIPGVGHQICCAENGTYIDPPASVVGGNRFASHYGRSASQPVVIQSYDPGDPANEAKMGRAKGAAMPKLQLSTDNRWNFNSFFNNSGGIISNLAVRGFRIVNSDGARVGKQITLDFANIDGSNFLFENLDCGGASLQINNNSGEAPSNRDARWSRNLIVRKCLFDRCVAPGSRLAAVHTSGWAGVTIEDCIFTHNGWSDTSEDRYVANTAPTGGPTIFLHDNYNAGGSQWPNQLRRNVSLNAAATFASNRNNLEAYQNVVIGAPIAGGAGGGVANITLEQPNGNYVNVHHNFSVGSQTISAPKAMFSANPSGGYVMAGGYVLGLSTTPGVGQVQIGSTLTQTIDNVVSALNTSTRPYTSRVSYKRVGQEIRQTLKEPGVSYVMMSAGGDPAISALDGQPRSFPFGLTGPVQGSEVHHNLSINSGYLDGSENMFMADGHGGGPGADGVVSYGSFHDNKLLAWTTRPLTSNVDTDFYHATYTNETYELTSPYTNKQVWQALGYADEVALEAAMIADHTKPWALIILAKAKELFGHDFEVPVVASPTLVIPTLSTLAPKVGETVTFPDPIISGGGMIVSAATYVDNIPQANTGKAVNSLVVTTAMVGKRLSRMVVVKGENGAPSATAFYQIEAKVGEEVAMAPSGRTVRFVIRESTNGNRKSFVGVGDVTFRAPDSTVDVRATWSDITVGNNEPTSNLNDADVTTGWVPTYLASVPDGAQARGVLPADMEISEVRITVNGTDYAPSDFDMFLSAVDGSGERLIVTRTGLTRADWTSLVPKAISALSA